MHEYFERFEQRASKRSTLRIVRNIIKPDVKEVRANELTKNSPWPQPSPMNPFELPSCVVHVPEKEIEHFIKKVVRRYVKTIQTHSFKSLTKGGSHKLARKLNDKEFCDYIFRTCFSKILSKNISPDEHRIFFDVIEDKKEYFTYNLMPLKTMKTYPDMYTEGTISLFEKKGDQLFPCAIYIKQQVVTPDEHDRWELAKLYVMQGASIILTACIHPRIHFPVDSINGISKTLIPKEHILFQLLSPHMYIQLPLNFAVQYISKSIAHGDQSEIYTPYPCGRKGFFEQVALGYRGVEGNFRYPKYSYPLSVERFETDYSIFLEKYWLCIYRFVKKIVEFIDCDSDLIRLWANSIAQYVPGFPNAQQMLKKDVLAKALTSYIHNCSVSHAVDHYTYSRIPLEHSPLRIRIPFPSPQNSTFKLDLKDVVTREDYIRHKFANLMFFKENNLTLLADVNYAFKQPELKKLVREFHADLKQTEKEMPTENYIPLSEIAASIQY